MRNRSRPHRGAGWWVVAALLVHCAGVLRASEADGQSGEARFASQCATCHGAQGEGTAADYPWPLAGDLTVSQLADLIARSMPADDPDACVGEDAQRVAEYVHEAFYSKRSSERAQPRIELSRLTVRQYRASIADMLAQLAEPEDYAGESGLRGEYWTRDMEDDGEYSFERIDSQIHFEFGERSPAPGKLEPEKFAIYWEGSLHAPETGDYEFIVQSENSVRLWVNDLVTPVIDSWVKSGDEREYRATVRLLGGRSYPLHLDFAKGTQGEDMPEDQKSKPPIGTAGVKLLWKLPSGIAGVIPQRALVAADFPSTLVVQTPFPPDDRSLGFERGTSISREWDQATTAAAIEVAEFITERLGEIVGREEGILPIDRPRLQRYCGALASLAFRRPLHADERTMYIDQSFASSPDLQTGMQRAVLKTLKSPRFLYRDVGGEDDYTIAERLSYALWDSIPDAKLTEAAKQGKLNSPEQVAWQARRMVDDPRTVAKLREFFVQWLKIDASPRPVKDDEAFPGFDELTAADLRESLELLLADVLANKPSDFRRLLLSEVVYLNGRLAALYGVDLPADAPFQRVSLDVGARAGLLTHPYMMAMLANSRESSPIRRGVFVTRSVLGRQLRPPPEAFVPEPADLHPGLSTRERIEKQTEAHECRMCHSVINPLGFTLEEFDAAGRLRQLDQGRPIDIRGSYVSRTGKQVDLVGARELAEFLAASDETHTALVEKLFQYTVNQPIRAFGWEASTRLREGFVADNFNLRELLVQIAVTFALRQPADEPAESRVTAKSTAR